MTLTTERQPTAAEVRARVDAARAEAAKADQRIAELRAQDARLESESAALLGEALAAGTSPQAGVRVKRERRAALSEEIETLRAKVAYLTTSADHAQRAMRDAEIRDAKATIAEAQRRIVERLTSVEPLLHDLVEIYDSLTELSATEHGTWSRAVRLLDAGGSYAYPAIARVGTSGPRSVVFGVLEVITSTGALRVESLDSTFVRLAQVRDAATAAAKANA
jgi:hypothetical protein